MARFGVFSLLSPMVISVASTSGHARTWRAMRSAASEVAARLLPSGVRRLISNCPSSFLGKKPFGTFFTSGTQVNSVATAAMATIQRRSITYARTRMYAFSIGR